jgi:hypothetical protein
MPMPYSPTAGDFYRTQRRPVRAMPYSPTSGNFYGGPGTPRQTAMMPPAYSPTAGYMGAATSGGPPPMPAVTPPSYSPTPSSPTAGAPSLAMMQQGTAGAYVSPAARQRAEYERALKAATGATAFPEKGTPEYDPALAQAQEQAKAVIAKQANAYATQRLNQLQGVLDYLPPELKQAVQGVSMVDPAAAWRSLSGGFSSASQAAGFQDPRMWLRYLQMQAGPRHIGV